MSCCRASRTLLTCLVLASCAPSASDQAQKARAALAEYRFDDARQILAESLSDHPNNATLLETLARTRLKMGDGDGAVGALDRLKRVATLPQDAPYLLAEAELLRGRADAASAALVGLNTAPAWRFRAWGARMDGQDAVAQQAFAKGVQAPGAKAHLLADYALLLLDYGRYPEARKLVDLARQEDPNLEQVLLAQGYVAQAEKRDEDAIAAFASLLGRMANHQAALKGMVQILGGLGKVDALRPYVDRGYKAYPLDPDFIFFAAKLAALDKDWPRALAVLQTGDGAVSHHHGAQALYGEVLIEQGQGDAAVQRLTVLHNQRLGDAAVRRLLARALAQTGEWPELAKVLQPLIDSGSARPEDLALFRRAMGSAAKTGLQS